MAGVAPLQNGQRQEQKDALADHHRDLDYHGELPSLPTLSHDREPTRQEGERIVSGVGALFESCRNCLERVSGLVFLLPGL